MRISDSSSDVCSSDLRRASAKRLSAPRHEARDFGNEKGGIDPCREMIIMRERHMSKVKQRSGHILLGSTILAAAWAFPAAAFAQEAESATEAEAPANNEIIVTAQRREESLSKVTVPVVAFGAESIQDRAIPSEKASGRAVRSEAR